MIDLTEEEKNLLRTLVNAYLPGVPCFVFGSRTSSGAHANADVDLMIRGDAPISPALLESLRNALSGSDFPYLVDLVDWHTCSAAFRGKVAPELVLL